MQVPFSSACCEKGALQCVQNREIESALGMVEKVTMVLEEVANPVPMTLAHAPFDVLRKEFNYCAMFESENCPPRTGYDS